MRKTYFKHTGTSSNTKDRSCTSRYTNNKLKNPRLVDKVRQSIYETMAFVGLALGTCFIGQKAFSDNTNNRVLDKDIFNYSSYYNINNNNLTFLEPDTLPLKAQKDTSNFHVTYLSDYNYNNIIFNEFQNNRIYNKEVGDSLNINKSQDAKKSDKQDKSFKSHNKSNKKEKFSQRGIASHMGHSLHGRKQASGEKHNKNEFICAHRTLPFGSKLKVTNLKTGKSVIVRVTDRGPYSRGRIIDISLAAAKKLEIEKTGLTKVEITLVN